MRAAMRRMLAGLPLLVAASVGPGAPALADVGLVCSFEDNQQLAGWDISGEWSLSREHATQGRHSLHVQWPQGRGLVVPQLPDDWSHWQRLRLDYFNGGPPFCLTLRVDDAGTSTASSWYHYVRTGAGTLEFIIQGLAQEADVSRIQSTHLRVDPSRSRPLALYLDNLRFTRDEPAEVYEPSPTSPKPILEPGVNLLPNGDFENGLQDWQAQGDLDGGQYAFAAGTGEQARSGSACVAIICSRIGRARLTSTPMKIPAGVPHELSLWVRGSLGGGVRYGFTGREPSDPQEAVATTRWQRLSSRIVVDADEQVRVRVDSLAPGVIYIDGARVVALGEAGAAQESRSAPDLPGNRLINPNFELGLHGWGSWGTWDGGQYEFGAGEGASAYSGSASAAVTCLKKGRGGIFTRPVDLPEDRYTLRFMAKASQPSSIRYGVVYPGGDLFSDARVSTEWAEYTVEIESTNQGAQRVYLMSTGEGIVYFDEVSLVGSRPIPAQVPEEPDDTQVPTKVELRGGHTYVNGEPFFALGMYRASPADLAGTAFNIIPGWDAAAGTALEECARAGIYLLPDLTGVMRGHLPQRVVAVAEKIMRHPAVLAWYLCDEPDHQNWSVPPDEMRLATKLLHELDPVHPTCTVVMPWAASNLYRYADTVDILMTDIYPIGDRRPADLSDIPRGTALMRRAVSDERPVWAVLQATARGTPAEHVAATYLAVAQGADGIFYWEYDDAVSDPGVWDQVRGLAWELNNLASVLTSPDARMQAKATSPMVHTLTKSADDSDYLIAVNGGSEPVADCAISLPGCPDGECQVLFEERTVRVADGGLQDGFDRFERHVYRLP